MKARVERTYAAEVAAVLPYSEAMMALGSAGLFAVCQPDHSLTSALRQVAMHVLGHLGVPLGGLDGWLVETS